MNVDEIVNAALDLTGDERDAYLVFGTCSKAKGQDLREEDGCREVRAGRDSRAQRHFRFISFLHHTESLTEHVETFLHVVQQVVSMTLLRRALLPALLSQDARSPFIKTLLHQRHCRSLLEVTNIGELMSVSQNSRVHLDACTERWCPKLRFRHPNSE